MKTDVEVHPRNAKGKYYIDRNACTWCGACECEAPDFFKYGDDESVYYVARQPENPEEEAACREAMICCPVEAICDDG